MKVAIFGTSLTGLVTAASLAEVGHSVTVIEQDRATVTRLREGHMSSHEPGLSTLMQRNAQELRLDFSTNVGDGSRGAEVVILAVGSQLNPDGVTDMSEWATTAGRLASLLRPYTVVIVAGTVRPGGTQLLRTILEEDGRRAGRDFDIVTVPTILSTGRAVNGALSPRRIVIGGASDHALRVLRRLYAPFTRQGAQLVTIGERSAEVMRYAAAALQVVLQSYAREVSEFCEEGGANIAEVLGEMGAIVTDGSYASHAGHTLAASPDSRDLRDARAMAEMSGSWGCSPWTVSAALDQVPRTAETVLQRLRGAMGDDFDGKRVALWGLAGTGEGDESGESVGLQVARTLLSAGAHVVIHAPCCGNDARTALGGLADLTDSPMAALASADALVVLCDIRAVRATDFSRVRRLMTRPVIVDPLWLWNPREMRDAGVAYNDVSVAAQPIDGNPRQL